MAFAPTSEVVRVGLLVMTVGGEMRCTPDKEVHVLRLLLHRKLCHVASRTAITGPVRKNCVKPPWFLAVPGGINTPKPRQSPGVPEIVGAVKITKVNRDEQIL